MFDESARLVPEGDTLTLVQGYLGSYPNFGFDMQAGDLGEFGRRLKTVTEAAGIEALAIRLGVRRTSPESWTTMDWMAEDFVRRQPAQAGLLDLGRYENF